MQAQREVLERERAREAADEHEAARHAHRAEKAGYLRRRLNERARAERGPTAVERLTQRLGRWVRRRRS